MLRAWVKGAGLGLRIGSAIRATRSTMPRPPSISVRRTINGFCRECLTRGPISKAVGTGIGTGLKRHRPRAGKSPRRRRFRNDRHAGLFALQAGQSRAGGPDRHGKSDRTPRTGRHRMATAQFVTAYERKRATVFAVSSRRGQTQPGGDVSPSRRDLREAWQEGRIAGRFASGARIRL